jgi:hypothetical protein
MVRHIDLTGQKFNFFTVLHRDPIPYPKDARWICRCDCGTIKSVRSSRLRGRDRQIKSCGCKRAELNKHGNTKHGLSRTVAYRRWVMIRRRCYRPNDAAFQNYGGRGIKLCPEWENDPVAFINYWGKNIPPHLSIERIDNNGDYSPENCKLATAQEQGNNRRTTRFVILGAKKMSASQAARKLGLNRFLVIEFCYPHRLNFKEKLNRLSQLQEA